MIEGEGGRRRIRRERGGEENIRGKVGGGRVRKERRWRRRRRRRGIEYDYMRFNNSVAVAADHSYLPSKM